MRRFVSLLFSGVCAIMLDCWGEWKNHVVKGLDRDLSDVWSLVVFTFSAMY